MTQHHHHLNALADIRAMMERSSKFISLSGLSGVGAGLCALIGAGFAFYFIGKVPFAGKQLYYEIDPSNYKWGLSFYQFFLLDGLLVLIGALGSGIFFTTRRAKRKGQKVWDNITWRLLRNLAIPLVTGGIYCFALFQYQLVGLIAPSTLIFYGLALVSASKYTLPDIRYLGISEVALGLIALFNLGYGLECWTIGFGVLHILYGLMMYWKYERQLA